LTEPCLPTPRPTRWHQAGRALLTRLLAELAYEELLAPEPEEPGEPARATAEHPPIGRGPTRAYRVSTPAAVYRFQARRGTFGSWWIEPASLRRAVSPALFPADADPLTSPPSAELADDPVRFLLDAQGLLGWPDDVLADVVRDMLATQAADLRLAASARPAAVLAELSLVELEGHQSGHPCLVANKGRLGFGAAADRYSPEARSPFRLPWVAVHPALGVYEAMGPAGTAAPTGPAGRTRADQAPLLREELDGQTRARFVDTLSQALAGTPHASLAADYLWLPVHPWQWENVIVPMFAAELATGRLVALGEAPDRYLPLQAVRTLANIDRPERRNTKLALMIRNTLVWRGMSAADAAAGPAVSRWLLDLRASDPFLRDVTGVLPLAEVAGAAVAHPTYDALPAAPYRLHELLGVLWRDPVEPQLDDGERVRSLASLLLTGSDGRALVAELVARSGRSARESLAALLGALLPPLLHYLYRYGVAFTPHGENVLCVFDAAHLPRRIAIKDFGADIELVEGVELARAGLAGPAEGHCRRWPARVLAHSLLSAVFAGHFRYFSVLVADHLQVEEEEFWRLVRREIDGYHARFPELRDRVEDVGLLRARFERVCLNREQFAGAGFHDRADRDGGFDLMSGTVVNPVAMVPAGPAAAIRTEDA